MRPNQLIRVQNAISVFLLAASILVGCDNSRLYEDNTEFKNRFWKVEDEPRFDFVVEDTTVSYNVFYNIRNSIDYPYARIFVTAHLYDSTGQELTRKLLNNDLFDQKTGTPFGDSGLGDLYDHQFPFLQNYQFAQRGKYTLKLDQFMRQDTLRGIIAVGVRVERQAK